eukprot:jgi/Tetstr1/421781/TSEL_012684.t1
MVHRVLSMKQGNAWQRSELEKYNQAGKCPPSYVVFMGEGKICEATPHSEAAVESLKKVVALPLAGTATPPKLHGFVGVLKQQQQKKGGIIVKHNTNAVNNLAATQPFPGDNVDKGSSLEPPAKRAKQPAKPAARDMECRPGPGAVLEPERAVGRSGRGPAARPPW